MSLLQLRVRFLMPSMLRSSEVIMGRSSVKEFSPMHMATLSSVNDGPEMLHVVWPRRAQHEPHKNAEKKMSTNEGLTVKCTSKHYWEICFSRRAEKARQFSA